MIPVIIPAYEPDDRLVKVVNEIKEALDCPIIIVNDGSSSDYDAIFEAVRDKCTKLISYDENKGKGFALKRAFEYCLKEMPEMTGVVTADSDGQHSIDDIKKIQEVLAENTNNLILGVRDFSGQDIPYKSQFGNRLTARVFKCLYKTKISDTQTGLRGIPTAFMQKLLSVAGDRFEFEIRMLIKAIDINVDITEVSIETIYDSKEHHTTHFRPVADSIRIYEAFGFAFWKFLLSSLSSSVLDLLLFQTLCFGLKNRQLAFDYVVCATVIARIFSAIYNYIINYAVVFKSTEKHVVSAGKYFVLAVIQMSCSAYLTSSLVNLVCAYFELFVKVPVDVLLFCISYQIQKRLIYKKASV